MRMPHLGYASQELPGDGARVLEVQGSWEQEYEVRSNQSSR